MRSKPLIVVMIMLVTVFIGFGIIIPVMPELVRAVDPGRAEWHNGLMLTVYSAVSFLVSPFWGRLSDRVGRRPVILTGILGFAVSFLLFGLASGHLALMYASRVLGGLFSGAVTSVIVAYVADSTTPEERTKGMGLVGMSIGLGFTIGPAFGGLLSTVSLEAPFFAASALSGAMVVAGFVYLKESLAAEKRGEAPKNGASRWSAFRGPLKYLYVLAFFVTFSLAGLEATLQFFGMRRFDVTPYQFGLMFFVCGLAGALVQGGVVRRYIKQGDEPRWIAAGLVLSAAGFLLILTSHSLVSATIYLCIFGIGNSLIRPCVTSLITQRTTVGQGTASGLSSAMDSLGRIAGPLTASALFTVQLQLPYLVGGILSLAAIGLLARFVRFDRRADAGSPQAT